MLSSKVNRAKTTSWNIQSSLLLYVNVSYLRVKLPWNLFEGSKVHRSWRFSQKVSLRLKVQWSFRFSYRVPVYFSDRCTWMNAIDWYIRGVDSFSGGFRIRRWYFRDYRRVTHQRETKNDRKCLEISHCSRFYPDSYVQSTMQLSLREIPRIVLNRVAKLASLDRIPDLLRHCCQNSRLRN